MKRYIYFKYIINMSACVYVLCVDTDYRKYLPKMTRRIRRQDLFQFSLCQTVKMFKVF